MSDVASGLLDPRFDLASWLDEHDPEVRARGSETVAAVEAAVPTNSELRRGSVVMNVQSLGVLPKQEVPELTLTVQGGVAHPITKPVTSIGRHPENDIVIADEYVSARHAQVRLEVNAFLVSDVGAATARS